MHRTLSNVVCPEIFKDYLEFCSEFSFASSYLPTTVFWYGMNLGQNVVLHGVPKSQLESLGLDNTAIPENRNFLDVQIQLGDISEQGNSKVLSFTVNGREQRVQVDMEVGV